jgi:hypothetical protein
MAHTFKIKHSKKTVGTQRMPRVSKGLFVGSFALIGGLIGFYVQDKLLKQLEERERLRGEVKKKEEK